jgi:hypothetical protein
MLDFPTLASPSTRIFILLNLSYSFWMSLDDYPSMSILDYFNLNKFIINIFD